MRDFYVKDLVLRLEKEIENDFPDKVRDVEKLMLTNQMAKAEKVVNEVNFEEPNSARAFYIKGKFLYLNGSLQESHKFLVKAIEMNPKMEKAIEMEAKTRTLNELVETASKFMVDQDYSAAIERFTKAIEFDVDNHFIIQASHFQRALANFNMGNFDAAFEDYKSFEMMKKVVGNVLQNIEIPAMAKMKREKEVAENAEKKLKAKKLKKKKKKNKFEEMEVKTVTKLQTLDEREEFEHDSLCELSIGEKRTESDLLEVAEIKNVDFIEDAKMKVEEIEKKLFENVPEVSYFENLSIEPKEVDCEHVSTVTKLMVTKDKSYEKNPLTIDKFEQNMQVVPQTSQSHQESIQFTTFNDDRMSSDSGAIEEKIQQTEKTAAMAKQESDKETVVKPEKIENITIIAPEVERTEESNWPMKQQTEEDILGEFMLK